MKTTSQRLLGVWPLIVGLILMLPLSQVSAATQLNYNQPVAGTLSVGQQAEYTFTGRTGDKPIISANAHGGDIVPYIGLYDPRGHLIGEDVNGGPKGNALLKGQVLATDGTYKVVVANKAQSGSGGYNLLISEEQRQVFFDGTAPGSGGKQAYQLSKPWNHTNITYHIINKLPQYSEQDIRNLFAQAFQSWASLSTLRFTEVAGQGDINIQFGQIDGQLNILGETCPPYQPCDSGSVTFDSDENWTLGQPNGYGDISLLGVASHEFGHAVGMLHTDDQNALMYPEYSPYVLAPTQDDAAGVARLYGPGNGTVSNPPSSSPPSNNPNQMQVSDSLNDQHYTTFWDFDVVAGDTATITMTATQGDLDSFLVLLDANNNVIAYDDDSGGGRNAALKNLKFPYAGTYTVAATRYLQAQGYSAGTYSLSIQYDVGSGQNTVPATTVANAPPVSGNGAVQVSKGQASQIQQLPALDTVLTSAFADSAAPGKQTRQGTVSRSQSYVWQQNWCAQDAQTLSANLQQIRFGFAINGQPIDASQVTTTNVAQSPYQCALAFVVLSNWSPGNVTLTSTLTLTGAVFDGENIYPAGDYVNEYQLQAS